MSDDIYTTASDWEVCFVGGVGFGVGGAAGMYFSVFRSKSAGALEPFYLTTAGAGLGGNLSGFDLSQMNGMTYSPVEVVTPFSVTMLHLAGGTMVSGGVGLPGKASKTPLSFGYSRIDAARKGATLFRTSSFGPGAGSGAGGGVFAGLWYSHRLNNNSANPLSAYGDAMIEEVQDITGTITRGIRDLYVPRF